MNITNTPTVQNAVAATQTATADAVNVHVLKKALDLQATTAATLLQAIPQPPLATSGSLGTQLNVRV